MAEVKEKVQDVQETVQDKVGSGTTGNTVLKAAAAAAATGAATYAVKKALSHDGSSDNGGSSNGDSTTSKLKSSGSGIISSAASTGWDAASDVLLPLADDMAEAAGKYVATHGPDVLRERIIPKFIETFNDAK
jgi:hypothetical protein